MLNKIGLIGSSWIWTSEEQFIDRDLVVLHLQVVQQIVHCSFTNFKFMPIRNDSHGIPGDSHGLWVDWWLLCSQVIATELSGRQYIFERLETSREYIPTHKTYFQVGRILWCSWLVRLNRNREILSSILAVGDLEKNPFGHFWLHVPGLARGLVLWTRSAFEKHWFKTIPANISVPLTETFPARAAFNLMQRVKDIFSYLAAPPMYIPYFMSYIH